MDETRNITRLTMCITLIGLGHQNIIFVDVVAHGFDGPVVPHLLR